MSQENVEIIRRCAESMNRRDVSQLLELFDADIEYYPRSDEPDPSPHIGREAYGRLVRGFVESFSEISFEILELIDAGDHVIASTVLNGRGSASGAEVSDVYVFVYKLRDGLVVEGREYRTREQALKAVGLSEQDAHADA
jgi:ketosteroid isomerase-like protein